MIYVKTIYYWPVQGLLLSGCLLLFKDRIKHLSLDDKNRTDIFLEITADSSINKLILN